jgi:hypothetical protein
MQGSSLHIRFFGKHIVLIFSFVANLHKNVGINE